MNEFSDKYLRYMEVVKAKGLKAAEIDPPLGRLLRIFYKQLPPLSLISFYKMAFILGTFWGAAFYPLCWLLMNFTVGDELPFNLMEYFFTIIYGQIFFGISVAYWTKRKLKKYDLPDWDRFQ